MEDQNDSDLVEVRKLCDKFFEHIPCQPDEALRYFKLIVDQVKALKEEQSIFYQPAQRLLDTCLQGLRRISPMLPTIMKGLMEGRDENWLRIQCSELDVRIVSALTDYIFD